MRIEAKLPDEAVNYRKHSHLSEFFVLIVAVVALLWAIFTLSSTVIWWGVSLVPQRVEAALFQKALSDFTIGNIDGDRRRRAAVQSVLDKLVKTSPEINIPLTVLIVKEPIVNAFAVPGGRIVVTTGLLKLIKSENELAMVLGHEMGHFKARHHLRGIGLRILVATFQMLMGVEPQAEKIVTQASTIVDLSFSRKDEQAADEFGLLAVYRAYGHVGGTSEFFRSLEVQDPTIPGAKYVQTHPLSSDRREHLEQLADSMGYPRRDPAPRPSAL